MGLALVGQAAWPAADLPVSPYGFGFPRFNGTSFVGKSPSGNPRITLNVRLQRVRVKKCSPKSTACDTSEPMLDPAKSSVEALYDQ